jgi:hypothetical protein
MPLLLFPWLYPPIDLLLFWEVLRDWAAELGLLGIWPPCPDMLTFYFLYCI